MIFMRPEKPGAAFVESVTPGDGQTSHWGVKASAGRTVQWDSVLTEDVEGELVAWESAEGAEIKNAGRMEIVKFAMRTSGVRVT
jgi:uncharacterized membrane protein